MATTSTKALSYPQTVMPWTDRPPVGDILDPFTASDLERVTDFGRGVLWIEDFAPEPTTTGCPGIAWMDYRLAVEGGYGR